MADTKVVSGQESYRIESDLVEAFVTRLGGHCAPVRFRLPHGVVEPFHIAPWAEDPPTGEPNIIQVLRGDFFCMPFGGNDTPYEGERHPVHGQTANEAWQPLAIDADALRLELHTTIRPARVEKQISLRPGQTAIYSRHTISDMTGRMSFGHHAILKFRSPGLVSTKPFAYGQVLPRPFENPVVGGYTSLKQGARFDRLERVPMTDGGDADLSIYPAREGFEDLVMVLPPIGTELGWSAVVFPQERYLWLSLKDARVLPGTVFWHSNGGRHYAPWSGRHRGVLGIEEVCSWFHVGLAESAHENDLSRLGFRTCHEFLADQSLPVSTIMLVAEAPSGFDHVQSVTPTEGGVAIESRNGQRIVASVDLKHLS